ncbi:TPA: hypothetical protein HA246_02015 [Candidatus Woesearchaeota archaeon]|nr:hypothetical protein [Candidatus Woesearchaeota archaeon]
MGILSVFKKKDTSILDTPPPMQMQTNPVIPLDLDLPPIPSLQSQQSMQSIQKSTSQQMDVHSMTFPDIPDETQMDAPPSDFEFDINDNLSTQQKTSNVYKEKAPEIPLAPPSRVFIQQPMQRLPNKPMFVSLMQVKRAMNNVETLYNDVTIAGDTIYRFFQLYADMDQCYIQWQRTLDHLQEDMVDLDKALFRYS